MLTKEETGEVVNGLSDRLNQYFNEIDDGRMRFYAICADVGISQMVVASVINWIIESHYGRSAEEMFADDPEMAISYSHTFLAGIEVGKKIAQVIADDANNVETED